MMCNEPFDTRRTKLHFSWAAAMDIGLCRRQNEDACRMVPEIGLFVVADGMGGHLGGELASRIIIDDLPVLFETRFDKLRTKSARNIRRLIQEVVSEQSYQVYLEGNSESGFSDMGATLALVFIYEQRAYIANLGDSRVYRFRQGRLKQLSRDHSVIRELLEQGAIEPGDIHRHPARGQITRYVGMDEKALPLVRSFTLLDKDRLLLCTDGLTDMLSDKEITAILKATPDTQAACDKLIVAANNHGGYDNITAVIVDWH